MIEVALHHTFANFTLNVAFSAGPEVIVLFGPSGVGKSLTVRAIAGLFTPQKGRITVNGAVWLDTDRGINLPPQARRVGYVPQHYGLFPHMSVAENVAFGLRALPRPERQRRVRDALALMQLQGLEDRKPRELSGGQQQRVALARALVIEPEVLLLDEALGALDQVLREELQEEVRLIQRRYAIPVLLITHDLGEAYSLADRLVVLQGGRIVQVGSRDDVFRRPATPEVARAVGMRNIFQAVVQAHTKTSTQIRWAGHVLHVPRLSQPVGAPITFAVRPEDILFVRERVPLESTRNIIDAVVVADRPTSFDHLLTLRLAQQPEITLYVRLPHALLLNLDIRLGQRRRVLMRESVIHVFETGTGPPPDLPRPGGLCYSENDA